MDKLLDSSAALLDALVNYPRAEVFIVFGLMLLLPLVALTCICLRGHRRSGENGRDHYRCAASTIVCRESRTSATTAEPAEHMNVSPIE